MTKTVDITIDVDIARKMLAVAGFNISRNASDEEIFAMVLSQLDCYGVTYKEEEK